MSGPDRIDEAWAAWRAATEDEAPAAALVERITRATASAPLASTSLASAPLASASLAQASLAQASLAQAVWRLGRPALAGLAVAAALLLFAATRSLDRLADDATTAIEALTP